MSTDAFPAAVLIGGPAASGKTTIARLLARKYGLRWYSTDAHGWHHRARAVARGLHDEDDPTPGDFDRAPLIEEDLVQLTAQAPTTGTVIEGALITPDFAPLARSVWLMPSAAEQRRRLADRSGTSDVHSGLSYGHRLITEQLSGTSATVINVDEQTVSATLTSVEAALRSVLNRLPVARTTSQRRQATRYGNRSLTDQLQVGIDNGRVDPICPESATMFDCECGHANCTATIRLQPVDAIRLIEQEPGAIRAQAHDGG